MLNQYIQKNFEHINNYIEEMAAAYFQKTNADPSKTELVVDNSEPMKTKYYFQARFQAQGDEL